MRRNLPALFVISILVNIGMWLERVFIVTGSTAHDFMPHAWGHYMPTWVEMTITFGSFTWFLFWFFGFSKLLPTVPLNEVKASIRAGGPEKERLEGAGEEQAERVGDRQGGVLAVFGDADDALAALRGVWEKGRRRVEVYSPINLPEANLIMGRPKSPVRFWTLAGALLGHGGRLRAGHRRGARQQPDRRRQAARRHHPVLHRRLRGHHPAGHASAT